MKYEEYKQLDLTKIGEEIRAYWEHNETFEKGQRLAEGHPAFVFYDGPPSANGKPGIHHVMARTIKDVFCRYKSQKGFFVDRKAGWDTHGLPVELGVEKNLGITKEDIGKKISVDEYNRACRTEVLKYKDLWDELTKQMGYWVDLKHPYITFDNEYIETLWYLLKQLYDKGLLYKGYTIQPFSPAAGTGLSSHELNMPGCYRDVKDTTCVALFRLQDGQPLPFEVAEGEAVYAMAWTTTPWTLPSNTALCVGPSYDYCLVRTVNPYTAQPIDVILATDLMKSFFRLPEGATVSVGLRSEASPANFSVGDKELPFEVVSICKGRELEGVRYEQLIPWVKPDGDAFRIILGDYVTTEDGTGIVHIAPTFGADDARVAKKAGIASLVMMDADGRRQPMVDRTGRFFRLEDLDAAWVEKCVDKENYGKYAGKYVKNAYDPAKTEKDLSLDVELVVMLKEAGKLFKSEKHTHSYPHCWRTDKPVLYYPLDSWFVRTTAVRERLIELNKEINWKPEATGSGRFGNWLENIVDWNLSRSRYWGTPLPIWRTEDGKEERCIGSVKELRDAIDQSVAAGFMDANPYASTDYKAFDLHRPYIDNVVLVSPSGRKMFREPDLKDVWFHSGAMPYAQIHYMGEPLRASQFPADFIAEGVDQTRGWFYTLHALATMCFDSVAFRNVVSNGLVLDKNGNKMSKRLGNAVDPFETIGKYGPDATRWYMITNSQPWDNLKFDVEGVDEVRRKLFGTLFNTYSFFALYANLDGFSYAEAEVPIERRPEIDRWILSELNTLVRTVDAALDDYEPTRAGRAIQEFVDANLSNWYVRLCRRRFWRGEYTEDKVSAYQTLYTCLETLARLMAPIAPFFSERLFLDLNAVSGRMQVESVHHAPFPEAKQELIDADLEERMELAQKVCSMVLSLRKRSNLRVRQPLARVMIPVRDARMRQQLEAVASLICSEVNVKELQYLDADNNTLVKRIKPNFKTLGPRFGKLMKSVGAAIVSFDQKQIAALESAGSCRIEVEGQALEIALSDVEIATQDVPGWVAANEGELTVALDITLTDALRNEGLARELVNRIQNIRKDAFEVTDRIRVELSHGVWDEAVRQHHDYICRETLADELRLVDAVVSAGKQQVEVSDGVMADISVQKV